MVSKKLTISNPSGLHLRPAGVLSKEAQKYQADSKIVCNEKSIVLKSVLNIMAAGIKCGAEVELICEGADEEAALAGLSEAIESGLGE